MDRECCTVRPFVSHFSIRVSGTPRVQKDYKNYYKKSKNGFAEYPGIERTGSREPVRTP